MTPLIEATLHLVGGELDEIVAFLAGLHSLEFGEELEYHVAVVSYRDALHGIVHGLRLGVHGVGLLDVVGPVYVELEMAHDGQMVPQLLLVVGALAVGGIHAVHDGDDGLGTLLALCLAGQCDGVLHHLLHLAAIFGQYQLLPLGVVVKSFYLHSPYCNVLGWVYVVSQSSFLGILATKSLR